MLLQEGAIPGPTEALLFGVILALEQQQGHLAAQGLGQLGCRHADRSQFGLQKPQATIGLHPLEDRELTVALQHRRHRDPHQPVHRQGRQHHPQTQGIQKLAQVHQGQVVLALQHGDHPIPQGVAVDRHIEVVGQRGADRHGDLLRATGPAQGELPGHGGGRRGRFGGQGVGPTPVDGTLDRPSRQRPRGAPNHQGLGPGRHGRGSLTTVER